MRYIIDTVERRIQRETDRKDFLHYVLAANDEKGLTKKEIYANAFTFSIAGSETTATFLSGCTFLILTHPNVYTKLVEEIRSAYTTESEIKPNNVYDNEYLEAVVMETLRIYPPVATTLPRIVPSGGETIDGSFVPAGTSVNIHQYACNHHPKNFYRPDDFLPERWMPEIRDRPPFSNDKRACVQPFSTGPRNCIGKNLARAEMRFILARLLWKFDLELVNSHERWMDGQVVKGFWNKPPLICKVSQASRSGENARLDL